ncbi:MAG: M20/M25/M40 family metallo-hydrolase [Pseudomonadota bacterium]
MAVDQVLETVDATIEETLERLFTLLAIPSISTDPAFDADCTRAADWLVADLQALGFDAQRHDTPGKPMVVGKTSTGTGPSFLFYGHYDMQPVDPLDLWEHDPFKADISERGGQKVIRGRGSSDDKGQLMTFIEACRAWKAVHGTLPGNLTIFLEGEEESGSPSLIPFLRAQKELLSADLALVCDTGMYDLETPSICTSLRGMLGEEITITGPNRDLHSGAYGGPATNPIRVLTKILAALHDDQGRVTVPGFYDGVPETPQVLKDAWAGLGFETANFLGPVGLSTPAGEVDRSVLEMIWTRPTCEFNGITGGYTGDGFKTVLPAEARAKVSFRLVGTQDPHAIRKNFRAMVEGMLPPDAKVSFADHGASPASVMPTDAPAFEQARTALTEEWGKEAVFVGGGGSIPVVGRFKEELGIDSMLVGFAQDDDAIHSPNEKYNLMSFHKGIRSWVRILEKLNG